MVNADGIDPDGSRLVWEAKVCQEVEGVSLNRHGAAVALDLLRVLKRAPCVGRCNEGIVGSVKMRRDELTDDGRRAYTWLEAENSEWIIAKERAVE